VKAALIAVANAEQRTIMLAPADACLGNHVVIEVAEVPIDRIMVRLLRVNRWLNSNEIVFDEPLDCPVDRLASVTSFVTDDFLAWVALAIVAVCVTDNA
jgi:hypothetical protein